MVTKQATKTQQATSEAIMPHHVELEQGILGTLLLEPEIFDKVQHILTPDDFYQNRHRTIFEALLRITERNEPIDVMLIDDEIKAMGRSADLESDPLYVRTELSSYFKPEIFFNIEFYIRRLQKLRMCRQQITGSLKAAALAYEGNAEEAQEILEKTAYELFAEKQDNDLIPIESMSLSFMDVLDERCQNKGKVTGVPTGFTDLDRLTGGLQKADLIILAARPAVGKSSAALSAAYNASTKYGKTIALFSLEMSKEQLFQRLVALDANVDQQKIRNGTIDDEDWEKIIESLNRLSSAAIYIDDTPAITCAEIKSKLRRMAASGAKADLVIVDYLQLMKTPGNKKNDNRVQEVSEISRELKGIARELNIPVLALAQLSREVEKRQVKIPQLSDLRESGSIEMDADIVMFIYRDEVYNPETERPNQADIIVAKHRNGPIGEVALYFDKKRTLFANLEVEQEAC